MTAPALARAYLAAVEALEMAACGTCKGEKRYHAAPDCPSCAGTGKPRIGASEGGEG